MADNGVTRMVANTGTFLREVRHEMSKVTWPDRAQLRSATIAIVIFVMIIGFIIFLMDWVLRLVFVNGIPSLFGA
jgi:preprotein translocase SecE subunit